MAEGGDQGRSVREGRKEGAGASRFKGELQENQTSKRVPYKTKKELFSPGDELYEFSKRIPRQEVVDGGGVGHAHAFAFRQTGSFHRPHEHARSRNKIRD